MEPSKRDAVGVGEGTRTGDGVRAAVRSRRDELFRSDWRNPRELLPLLSRTEDNAFQFLIEWCEEFDEVIGKKRDRLSDPRPRGSLR